MVEKSLADLTAEVDEYLAQADALKFGDPAALLHIAQTATMHAQTCGDFHRYARALVHQAWAYGWLNQYEWSLTHALEALVLARDYRMMDIEALAVGVIAFNFLKCGILQEAAHLFEHQHLLGEQLQDDMLKGMALNDLAVVKMELSDYETAAALLRQAVNLIPTDTHEALDHSITHINLAFACVKLRQFDDAVQHATWVLEQAPKSPKIMSDAHVWLAAVHLGQGAFQAAQTRITLARACVETAEPPIYNDNVEQLTAELLAAEGRYAEAAQVWEYMYTMALQHHELDYAISALNNLKNIYEQHQDTTGLVNTYKRLAEDIPTRQKQSSDLRFAVLRMVFALDKAALEAALQLGHQKRRILNRLSHEFRTPLAIIQSSAELMEQYDNRLSLEQRQVHLQRVTSQVKWMTVMLDDILEVLKLEEDNSSLLPHTTMQLDNVADAALRQIDRYRISTTRVRVHIQPGTPAVQGVPKALQTILTHLLTNALKFSPDEVNLRLALHDNRLMMQISDQGIGIPLEEQQEVFKPLVRGSNLDEITGNGLGLTIVAKLVRHLRGTIDLKSEAGTGTTITVHIPLP